MRTLPMQEKGTRMRHGRLPPASCDAACVGAARFRGNLSHSLSGTPVDFVFRKKIRGKARRYKLMHVDESSKENQRIEPVAINPVCLHTVKL